MRLASGGRACHREDVVVVVVVVVGRLVPHGGALDEALAARGRGGGRLVPLAAAHVRVGHAEAGDAAGPLRVRLDEQLGAGARQREAQACRLDVDRQVDLAQFARRGRQVALVVRLLGVRAAHPHHLQLEVSHADRDVARRQVEQQEARREAAVLGATEHQRRREVVVGAVERRVVAVDAAPRPDELDAQCAAEAHNGGRRRRRKATLERLEARVQRRLGAVEHVLEVRPQSRDAAQLVLL